MNYEISRIMKLTLGFFLVLLFTTGNAFGETHRILFIGNSYTFYNSMPRMFKAMASDHFPDQQFETKFIGGGGATLKKHWEVGQALNEIQTGEWDFVVLQEQSTLGSKNLEDSESWGQFYKYARMFDHEIQNSGSETVFYMTWSRKGSRFQQEFLKTAYENIAQELDSRIAPVGMVWDNIRDDMNIDLYMKDGSHPTASGSFLAAMTLLATILEVKPEGMSGRLEGHEILRGGVIADDISTLCDLPNATVRAIEKAVWAHTSARHPLEPGLDRGVSSGL